MDTKHIEFGVERVPLVTGDGQDVNREAIRRIDNKNVLGIVTPSYRLVTHKEALDKCIGVVEHVSDLKFKRVITTYNGARMYATFESEQEYTIANGDNLKLRLTLTNSYDGLLRYGFIMGAYRLVCKNGLRVGQDIFAVRQKHTSGLDVNALMKSATKAVRCFNEETMPKWRTMNNTNIVVENVMKQLESRVPKRLYNEVTEKVAGKQETTMWELYNDFTEIVTHNEKYHKSFERNDEIQKIVARAFDNVVVA